MKNAEEAGDLFTRVLCLCATCFPFPEPGSSKLDFWVLCHIRSVALLQVSRLCSVLVSATPAWVEVWVVQQPASGSALAPWCSCLCMIFLNLHMWWSIQMQTLFPGQVIIHSFLGLMDIQCCYTICISQTVLPFLSSQGSAWLPMNSAGRAVLNGSDLSESEQSLPFIPVFSNFPHQTEQKMQLWFFACVLFFFFLFSPQSLKWQHKF